jgi:hypothetical protein
VLAAESAAFENLVVALENWVAASEMDDIDPASVGESPMTYDALKKGPGCGKWGLVLLPEGYPWNGIFRLPFFSISLSLFSTMIALSTILWKSS